MTGKPRLLFITRNFPPLTGGMERLAFHALQALNAQFETLLIGPEGSADYTSSGFSVMLPTQPDWRFFWSFFRSGLRAAREFRPDVIVAASGAVAPCGLLAARLNKACFITMIHGLDIIYPSWLYQALFASSIRRSHRVIANSQYTARLAGNAGVAPAKLQVLNPAVSASSEPPEKTTVASYVSAHKGSILLSVGRLVRRKGLVAFIAECLPAIVKQQPLAMLLVVGEEPEHGSRRSISFMNEIHAAIAKASLGNNVRLLGRLTDQELERMYAIADIHVFPIVDLPGDVEGFGMVALEAAAHGLPTVAFAAGGVADAIKEGVSGKLIRAGDYAAFTEAVIRLLQGKEVIAADDCRAFADEFTWERYGSRLCQTCVDLLQEPVSRP